MATTPVTIRSWTTRFAVAIALLAAAIATVAPTRAAHAADDGGFGAKMLELVNQHRASAGVAPLQASTTLRSVAQDARYDGCGFPVTGRANDMGSRNYFSHTILSCGTQGVSQILGALGVQTSGFGENIAWMNGTTDPILAATRLTNDLMASPTHKANILSANFTHVGIGSWRTAPGQTWSGGGYALTNVFIAAQVFGRLSTTTTTAPTTTAPTTTAPTTTTPTTRPPTTTTTPTTAPPAPAVAAVPGMPTEVSAVPGNGSITASWKAPTNPGTAIDGYAMLVFNDVGTYTEKYAWVCSTCTNATVPGLVNGRTYYAVVYAHNPNGWGTPAISDMVVAGTPGPPGNVTVARVNGSVNLTWTPASNSGNTIDSYGLFAFDANGYTGIYATACGTCTSGTVAGLANGHQYTIAVFPHNAFGWGEHSMSAPV